MILVYKGTGPYVDSRFIAQPGDKVEFEDSEAKLKLEQESDLWEEVTVLDGSERQSRRGVRSNS